MGKSTENLHQEITETDNIHYFLEDNESEFNPNLLMETINEHIATKKISKQQLVRDSGLNTSYVYDILNGKKAPSRDTVVKLCMALRLSLEQTNRLLHLAGHANLYPRIEREAIIIFCIERGKSLLECNDLLYEMKEPLLIEGK